MARRRMMDPAFWDDHHIAALSRDERLFLLGCIGNADDEGRLKGHPAYLKAAIFMYDDDLTTTGVQQIKQACLEKMASWPQTHPLRLISYENSREEYLTFPSWYDTQKPSHPTPSKLPPSPPDTLPIFSSVSPDNFEKDTGEARPQCSIGKVSIGKVSVVDIPEIDQDLILLGEALERYAGQLPSGADSEWMVDLKEQYPVSLIIENMNKAVEITGHWPGWKYIETMCKRGKGNKTRDRPKEKPAWDPGPMMREGAARQRAEIERIVAEQENGEREQGEHPNT